MNELLKIEWKKINVRGQIKGLIIANVVIFFLIIMLKLITMEQGDVFLLETTMIVDTLIKSTFLVWQAALIASLIVEELRSKTLMQIYTYPINRKSLIQAKLLLICLIIFTFIIVTQVIQNILLFSLNSAFPFIYYQIGMIDILQLFFTSIAAVMLGMFPLFIGIKQKSSVATIVSSLIVVSFVSNSQVISGGLITVLPMLFIFGVIGVTFASVAIKDMLKKDLII